MGNESSSSLTHILMLIFLLIQWVNYAAGHEVTYAQGMLNARVRIKTLQGGTQEADIAFAASSLRSGDGALPSAAAQVNPQIETHIIHPLCVIIIHTKKILVSTWALLKHSCTVRNWICSNRELWCDRVKKERIDMTHYTPMLCNMHTVKTKRWKMWFYYFLLDRLRCLNVSSYNIYVPQNNILQL